MRRLLVTFAVLLLALCSICVFADDGAYSEVGGGAASPMKPNSSIRMVREQVDIRLGQKGAVVKCVFVFKNEGVACSVQMGFPECQWATGEGWLFGGLQQFVSYVDGKKAEVKHRFPSEKHSEDNGQSQDYTSWYVKRVDFARGQTRTVEDDYFSEYGTTSSLGDPDGPLESFTYVLETGATWKGTIGQIVINIDSEHLGRMRDVELPKGCVKTDKNKWTWIAKNIKPEEDFKIVLHPRNPTFNGQRIDGHFGARLQDPQGVVMAGDSFIFVVGGKSIIDWKKRICTMKYNRHTLVMREGDRRAMFDSRLITLPTNIEFRTLHRRCEVPLLETVKLFGGSVTADKVTGRLNVVLKDRQTEEQRRNDYWGLK